MKVRNKGIHSQYLSLHILCLKKPIAITLQRAQPYKQPMAVSPGQGEVLPTAYF